MDLYADDFDASDEARVVVVGEPVDGNEALFSGTLEDAKAYVRRLPAETQAGLAIVTPGRIYDPREI
jgi:hypothetical protein